jgi:hypothetical protein
MKKILIHLAIFTLIIVPTFAIAQSVGLKNPVKVNSISELILIVTRVVRYIAIPFIVIMIMYSGFLYIWANVGSNAGGLKKANETLKYTIIGAFILLSSELIALVMKNTIEGLSR